MILSTQYGNFGSFKDLLTFMCLEEKESVFISECDWWGISCILNKNGSTFSYAEIEQIVG